MNTYNTPSPRFRYLLLAAAISVYLLIVLGGMVRVTGSASACPDWPTCFGQWTPPVGQNALIDYTHRAFTVLVVPLILASTLFAWKMYRYSSMYLAFIFLVLMLDRLL